MNSDIRIKTNLPQHPKVTKLRRLTGDDSFRCLIQLWCQVAMIKPSGDVSCWDKDDIEIAADWNGERGAFYSAIIKVGFLDIDGEKKNIHDWAENNPWAADADIRSLRASKNQVKRWCLRTFSSKKGRESFEDWYKKYQFKQGDNTTRILSLYQEYTTRNTPSPSPSPLPLPPPKDIAGKKKFGSLKNVFLSEKEYKKLSEKLNGTLTEKIENLSLYIASKGIKYKSHYATILAWDRKDKKENSPATQNTCQLCAKFCVPSSPDKCHKSATIKACKEFAAR